MSNMNDLNKNKTNFAKYADTNILDGYLDHKDNSQNYTSNSFPMIKGKKASLQKTVIEIKKLIKNSNGIHMDGLCCDQISLNKTISFAEKNQFSFNHMNANEISSFYTNCQRFGASFASFNEAKNRSDFILFIGWNPTENFVKTFIKNLNWGFSKKKKIFFLTESKQINRSKNIISIKKKDIVGGLISLANSFLKKREKKQYESIFRCYSDANFPVFIPKIESNNNPLILSLFSILKDLNNFKPTRILNTLGYNNIAGFINVCLTRTGFPNAL